MMTLMMRPSSELDGASHIVGAKCNRADPLDHEASPGNEIDLNVQVRGLLTDILQISRTTVVI